jgi:hypothetical protein
MPRARRAVALVVLVTFVGAETGCSWIFVKKEPPLPIEPSPVVECTTNRTAPTLDLVAAVLGGATAVGTLAYGAVQYVGCGEELSGCNWALSWATIAGVAAAAAAVTTVFAFSAGYGSKHAEECERLKALQAACVAGDQDACNRLRGGTPGSPAAPATPPAESWLREAAGLTSARLWPQQDQDR